MRKRADIEVTQLQFDLSRSRVKAQTLHQQLITAHLKLTAAEDNLAKRSAFAKHLKTHLDLDEAASKLVGKENAALRRNVQALAVALKQREQYCNDLRAELERRGAHIDQLQEQMSMDDSRARGELAHTSERLAAAEERAEIAEARAKLMEDRLRHQEQLAEQRAQMQADMQHYSQDLAKMALETGNAANVKLQQNMAEAQAALEAERRARAEAEAKVAVLEKEAAKLEKTVEAKERRITSLEEALQRQTATPAGPRAVDVAMDNVGAFVSQLYGSPESAGLPAPTQRMALPSLGGGGRRSSGAAAGGNGPARQKKPAAAKAKVGPPTEGDAEWERDEEKSNEKPLKVAKRSGKASTADKPAGGRKAKEAAATALPPVPEEETVTDAADAPAAEADAGSGGRPGGKRRRATKAPIVESGDEADENDGGAKRKKPKKAATSGVAKVWACDTAGEAEKENPDGGAAAQGPAAKQAVRPLELLTSRILAPVSVNAAATEVPLKPQMQRPILTKPTNAAGGKRRLLGVSSSAILGDALPASKLFGNNFVVPKLQGKQ